MDKSKKPGRLEDWFETFLFNCRFFVLFAVFGLLTASFIMFLKGSVEVIQGIASFRPMIQFTATHDDDKSIILAFIPAIDSYLFATILLIFSMGFYELFISKIDPKSRKTESRPNWLIVRNLDDLKNLISDVVITVLIINFFKLAFTLTLTNQFDLLILGGGIFLVAATLLLTHYILDKRTSSDQHKQKLHDKPNDDEMTSTKG